MNIPKLSLYKSYGKEINTEFDLETFNKTPLYKWRGDSDEFRSVFKMYYLNFAGGELITNNYGYSVGCLNLIQYIKSSGGWSIDTFHIMHDSVDDDHTFRICHIPIELYHNITEEISNFLHAPHLYIRNNEGLLGGVAIYEDSTTCLFDKFGNIIVNKYNLVDKVDIDY